MQFLLCKKSKARVSERGQAYNTEIVNVGRCKYGSKVPRWGLCFHFVVCGFVILNIGPVLTAWLNCSIFPIRISWSRAQCIVQKLFRTNIRSHFCSITVLTIGVNPVYNHAGKVVPCLWPHELVPLHTWPQLLLMTAVKHLPDEELYGLICCSLLYSLPG